MWVVNDDRHYKTMINAVEDAMWRHNGTSACLVVSSSIERAFYAEQIGIDSLPLLMSLCSKRLD